MTNRPRFRRLVVLAIALMSFADLGITACTTAGSGGSVNVLASWTGAEEGAFRSVLQKFTDETGITVNYTGNRALNQVLLADIQNGKPPDVAVLPSVGELARYIRSGDVQPVDGIFGAHPTDSYSAQWLQLLQAGMGKLYAVPVKADLKSIVWYNPAAFPYERPTTWGQLTAIGDDLRANGKTPWCVGMGATTASGFPGTDWIEDILLNQSGPDVYHQWAAGNLAWTSPEVRQAWTTWGEIVAQPGFVRGGPTAALLTEFSDAGKSMFANPPGCSLEHQASFIMGGYRNVPGPDGNLIQPGTGFDFFPFPAFDANAAGVEPTEVSADLAAMFQPSENARMLMTYLASEKGQAVWPLRGTAFSANKKLLEQNVYTDPVSLKIAETLTSMDTLCFDASDLMPAKMSDAFFRAVLEYIADPGRLDGLLDSLEKVRTGIQHDDWLNVPCGGSTR